MIKLTDLLSESKTPRVIDVTYIEQNQRFYGMYVGTGRDKIGDIKDASKIIYDLVGLELDRIYNEGELSKIAKLMKSKHIKFTYDDTMDVS